MYDAPWGNAKTSGSMSNSATASTAPELKPSSKCSRSRRRIAAVPPNPVEMSVTSARNIGANRMDGFCSDTGGGFQPDFGEPDASLARCYYDEHEVANQVCANSNTWRGNIVRREAEQGDGAGPRQRPTDRGFFGRMLLGRRCCLQARQGRGQGRFRICGRSG